MLRGTERPFLLLGAWAGGGAILGANPVPLRSAVEIRGPWACGLDCRCGGRVVRVAGVRVRRADRGPAAAAAAAASRARPRRRLLRPRLADGRRRHVVVRVTHRAGADPPAGRPPTGARGTWTAWHREPRASTATAGPSRTAYAGSPRASCSRRTSPSASKESSRATPSTPSPTRRNTTPRPTPPSSAAASTPSCPSHQSSSFAGTASACTPTPSRGRPPTERRSKLGQGRGRARDDRRPRPQRPRPHRPLRHRRGAPARDRRAPRPLPHGLAASRRPPTPPTRTSSAPPSRPAASRARPRSRR